MPREPAHRRFSFRRYFALLVAAWTVVIAGFVVQTIHDHETGLFEMAQIQARHSFDKDLVYRRWAAGHGGVYVPVTEETPPNPYLTDTENRDVTTTTGIALTLVNPAYMTRQVHELGREQYGLRGHITSLEPIRPENAPDPWETEALRSFEAGATQAVSLELIDGAEYLRLMRPLVTETGCLTCHARHGFKLGDIRGGISVSVPTAPLRSLNWQHLGRILSVQGFIWIAGLAAITLSARRIGSGMRERDRIAAQLKDSEAMLAAAGEMAKVGGWEIQADTLEVRWTEQTSRIHELPETELPTFERAMGFFHPDDRPKLELAVRRALEHGERFDVEARLTTATGRQVWIHSVCEPKVVDGKTVLLSGAIQDISQRKTTENELREQENKYRALFDNATDAVFIAQERGIRLANPATEAYLGVSQEEIVSGDFSRFVHEDDRAMVVDRYQRRLGGEAPPDTYAFRIVDKDGNVRWMELKATTLLWDGEPATLCFMRDITERRATEAELEAYRGRLEELVEERTAELQKTINLMAGREVRMATLKDEIRRLQEQLTTFEAQRSNDGRRDRARDETSGDDR